MRAEKQSISGEYLERLNVSPFFIVVDYTGLRVGPMTEFRKRLQSAGAEVHVVKNSLFRVAAREAGIADLGHPLVGQLAVITGQKDVSGAAKVVKTFHAEFERPIMRFGFLDNEPLSAEQLQMLADLPSLDVLRAGLLGVIMAPARNLAVVLNAPGAQIARVLKAHVEKSQ